MKQIYLFALLGLLFVSPQFSQAQFYKKTFGKLSETTAPIPSFAEGADAVYLFDRGSVNIEYYPSEEVFYLLTERHFRIKILNKSGFDYADIQIPYYDSGTKKEKIIGLKAITYNTVGGKLEKTKASTKKVYEEEVDENWRNLKFAMPNVKEGSVIEVCYTKRSPFLFNMDTWKFQKDIPVLACDLTVAIPEYFKYKITEKGYIAAVERKQSTSRTSINVPTNTESIQAGVRKAPPLYPGSYIYVQQDLEWKFENVPGFKPEAYTTASSNFQSQVDFELTSINLPSYNKIDFGTTWEAFDQELIEKSNFGQSLARSKFLTDPIAGLKAKHSPLAPSHVIDFVQNNTQWDGNSSLYTSKSLKACFQQREGNSADLNFLLIGALREAGFEAWPVILSTRQNGHISRQIPKRQDFNYVITGFVHQGETYLVDACQPRIPVGYLPWKCLNQNFRIVSKTNGGWLEFFPGGSSLSQVVKGEISQEGLISGQVNATHEGYYAFKLSKKSGGKDDLSGLKKSLEASDDLTVSALKIDEEKSSPSQTKLNYSFSVLKKAETAEGLMFFSPIFLNQTTKNPFKSENRMYPIDFGHAFFESQEVELTLPKGYKLESFPEAATIKLPKGKGLYTYQVELVNDNTLKISNKLIVNAAIFYSDEYAELRQVFIQLVEKEGEQIVLQKM